METNNNPRSEWLIIRRLDYKVGKSKYILVNFLVIV